VCGNNQPITDRCYKDTDDWSFLEIADPWNAANAIRDFFSEGNT
jgi:hypothetical protein